MSLSLSNPSLATISNGDVPSPRTPTHAHRPSLMHRTTTNQSRRAASISKITQEGAGLDPDELFTKHPVSEVKAIQTRLRAEAEAKQEELRLMVGERYRDLLQASTSIIAISKSSKRVLQDLEDAKAEILAQEPPPLPQETAVRSDDDLHTLQQLSAHLKLLLDAPEHLWRLIERKKYFAAAWLFLLSRVVHQALLQNDEDEETWATIWADPVYGVQAQFPLIQRQWEVVSQFRSQIIHKATLSLRHHDTAEENACATLLTLHLLDARPLADTFATLFSQRSKTLQTMISRNPREISRPGTPSTPTTVNGSALDSSKAATLRRKPVQEVRDAIMAALDLIARTIIVARCIYQDDATSPGLAGRVLHFIQSDASDASDLPADLALTTQSLLATLPSSTHFQLLPPTLRAYKPYVDLSSSSSHLVPHVVQKPETAIDRWFADLETVKEVWGVRKAVLKWIAGESGLKGGEASHIEGVFDDVCRQRLVGIWKASFLDTEKTFERQLATVVASWKSGADYTLDGTGHGDGLFHRYKASLRHQLLGRTATLNDSFAYISNNASDADARLIDDLQATCRPNVEDLCSAILRMLESSLPHANADVSMQSLLFVGRLADNLTAGSSFLSDAGCSDDYCDEFRVKTRDLYDSVIDRWRTYTVDHIIQQHRLQEPATAATSTASFTPSFALINALSDLSNAIQQLGIQRDQTRQRRLAADTLRVFLGAFLRTHGKQRLWGPGWEDVSARLDAKIEQVRVLHCLSVAVLTLAQLVPQGVIRDVAELERSAAAYLARVQLLLAALLPPREGGKGAGELLRFGVPAIGQEFQPALELARPAARFGLLLVSGGSAAA
ncbi:hypothetical protein BD626DRAFT_546460 [Schizophyllum amplum]|uniref:Conserved oligomeric Golgi complex subunit 1 n=1 Tax=Schizophyllum amplum TaxID=97359 RepID=A0A550CMX8_9AGAR|nr:hypothetical protein BD626DRAFT_546460 [Auriculariopsis ampla]